jgi:peptidoglycan hydrolase-like protein with peptidoglycan-binding domain
MKRYLGLVVIVLALAALSGCSKKQEMEELQPITMESLGAVSTPVAVTAEGKTQEAKLPATEAVMQAKEALQLPPQGPYKPQGMEIQTALKNAGFYAGKIDGKIGPKSKKAVEDFQSANGLKADGKVGAKTWEKLSKYLNAAAEPVKR